MKEKFIDQIFKNLELSGFPNKKVAFDVEKMYELADQKGLNFNNIIEQMKKNHPIAIEITTDKVIFSKTNTPQFTPESIQEMMSSLSPEQLEEIKNMYENMSDSEKEEMIQKGKDMGLL